MIFLQRNSYMKILLTFFILFFSYSVIADDISKFKIEGISIGDSLLEHMSENEINKNMTDLYNYIDEKKFITTGFFSKDLTSDFDFIQVTLKINDDQYEVYGVGGNISPIDPPECLIKQKEIDNDINGNFSDFEKFGPITAPHPVDGGKSVVHQISYKLNKGGAALIECYDFSNAVPYEDSFALSLYSDELNQWLQKYQ